jgi:hypothetical protein
MSRLILYCVLSGYAGLLAGIFLMSMLNLARDKPQGECYPAA